MLGSPSPSQNISRRSRNRSFRRILIIIGIIIGLSIAAGIVIANIYIKITKEDINDWRCEDFAEFGRRKWMQKDRLMKHMSTVNRRKIFMYLTLIELYRSPDWKKKQMSEAVEKSRRFFETCSKIRTILFHGLRPLRKFFFKPLGGWPLIESDWAGDHNTMIKVLGKLDRMGIYNGILSLKPLNHYYDLESFMKTIYITFDETSNLNYFKRLVSGHKVRDLLEELGKNPTTEQQVIEMSKFEAELMKITKTHPKHFGYDKMPGETLENLARFTNGFNWKLFLQYAMDGFDVEPNSFTYIYQDSFIKDITNFLMKADPRAVINYAIWTALRSLYPYTSQSIASFYDTIQAENKYEIYLQRQQWCISDQIKLFPYATIRAFTKVVNLKFKTKLLREMAANLTYQAKKMFVELKKFNQYNINVLISKLDMISMELNFPSWIENDAVLDEYYESVKMTDSHLVNVLALVKLERRNYFRKLVEEKPFMLWDMSPFILHPVYYGHKNFLVFPITATILVEDNVPMAINYATLGFFLGRKLMQAFDIFGVTIDGNGVPDDEQLDTEGKIEFKKLFECIREQYGNYCYAYVCKDDSYSQKTLAENIIDTLGLRLAFYAYREWLKVNQDKIPADLSEFEPLQLFFFGFAKNWHDLPYTTKLFNSEINNLNTLGKFRILGPCQNLEEFSETFNCDPDTPMNRAPKCKLQ